MSMICSKSVVPVLHNRFVCAMAACMVMSACVSAPPHRVAEAPAPVSAPEPATTPPPVTQVYFYPQQGQSPEQQDRDRYECYLWAMQQTGFDPSQPNLAPHQRVVVTPAPPAGHDTATGAVTGAVIGAAVSRPGDRAGGAVMGAIAGAAVGAASDNARQREAQRVQESYDRADSERAARIERQASEYRRAMAACLEGRGYSVGE